MTALAAEPRAGLVITGGEIQLQQCSLYVHRVPMLDSHHVIPESWWIKAGKPVGSPLKELCPDCHYATHSCIDGLIRGLGIAAMPLRCQQLARDALDGAAANGLTPALTL